MDYYSEIGINWSTQLGWIYSELCWKKVHPESLHMYGFICVAFSKWQNGSNEHIGGAKAKGRSGREEGLSTKWQHETPLWWLECSASVLYDYQYPGFEILLRFCKSHHWDKLGKGHTAYLCIFLLSARDAILLSQNMFNN